MIIRILLFSGLILHKLIWEVWKRRYPPALVREDQGSNPSVRRSPLKKIVKLCKIGFLLFLIMQSLFLHLLPITGAPPFLKYAGLVMFLAGLCISICARIDLGQNWIDLEDRQVLPRQVLVTRGIYRYIRHPIYLGDILLITGLELALNSWLFVLGFFIAVVAIRQAREEEKLLAGAFPEYAEYRLRTKRFLPFVV